jgi:hypothetical protein
MQKAQFDGDFVVFMDKLLAATSMVIGTEATARPPSLPRRPRPRHGGPAIGTAAPRFAA